MEDSKRDIRDTGSGAIVEIEDSVFIDVSANKVIQICPAIEQVCHEFALKRIGLSEALYRERGEDRTAKMVDDIVTGCLAEFGVYAYLVSKGYKPTKPDLSIHYNGQKSYGADLSFPLISADYMGNNVQNTIYCHVKSQSKASADAYGDSWLFQAEDKALALPSETAYSFLCTVDQLCITLRAVSYMIDILDNDLVSSPKVQKYGYTKKAVYLEDLLKSGIDLNRF